MKLSTIFLAGISGITAENAYATDFQVTKTRASRLNIRWGVGGDDNADDWQVSIMDQQGRHYTVNSKNPSWANREIRGLRPAQKYFITIRSSTANGDGESQTFEAYTSPRGVNNAYVGMRDQEGVLLEWDGIGGADQYRIVDDETGEANFINDNTYWAPMNPGQSKDFSIYTVACGSDCADPPNDAFGKPFKLRATSVPPAPLAVRLSDVSVADLDYADARIAWTNPAVGSWDNIKIEYSPNDPPAKTETPFYAPSGFINDSTMIHGLYQNTIYTFTVRFVSDNVEGPAESYTYAVEDYSFDKPRKPSTMTCRVPTYLRPENLRVARELFGKGIEDGPGMTVTWDHPAAKQPEGGYRLVFAPMMDDANGMTLPAHTEHLGGHIDEFTFDGHNYDPFVEYTVSLIALHDEFYQHYQYADFTASHFTGTATKNERNVEFVAPDACCGPTRHNSKDSSCCGGVLINDDSLCCGSTPYLSHEFKCCGNGNLVPVNDDC